MTNERKRALVIIGATFLIGILVGVLGSIIWNKYIGATNRSVVERDGGRERFIQKILGVVEADSAQALQMRPLMDQTMSRIDSLQQAASQSVHAEVDSLEIRLKPILSPVQLEKLIQFHQRGRERRQQERR